MKMHPKELWLLYDCHSDSQKQTRALAHSLTKHVNEFDLKTTRISKYRWYDILDMLHLKPKDLFNKANPKYQKEVAGKEFDDDGYLDILNNNPCMIKAPIAIMNGKAVLCESPSDIYKLTNEPLPSAQPY